MTSFNNSTVTWIIDTIMNMKNNRTEDTTLLLTSTTDVNDICNNFERLLKVELENRGGDIICSNDKKHLVSFNGAFFTITFEINTESINFKIVQYYDREIN